MIYEYQCKKCGTRFELERSCDERNDPADCPLRTCKGKAIKLISTNVNADDGSGSRIPGVCNSLPGDPVYVKNKAHFRELCKERATEKHGEIYPAGL